MVEEIYENIIKNLKNYRNKKTINKEMLLSFSADNERSVNYIKVAQYKEFEKAINKLCIDDKLIPKGSVKKGDEIYSNFYVKGNIVNKEKDSKNTLEISKLKLKDVGHYIKNQDQYIQNKKSIQKLNDYYIEPFKPHLTSNELAFKLFNNEKFFENPKDKKNLGLEILENLKMKYEDFNCYKTQEPFFYYIKADFFQKERRRILIIENKDTYSTLKSKKACQVFDMFIYGEGKKIISSFELAEEYNIDLQDSIEYFGDIDSEGFLIYKLLKEKFLSYNIKMCIPLYWLLVDNSNIETLPKLRSFSVDEDIKNNLIQEEDKLKTECSESGKYAIAEPRILSCAIEVVNSEFENYYSNKLIEILNSKKYIPQEAIALIYINQGLMDFE